MLLHTVAPLITQKVLGSEIVSNKEPLTVAAIFHRTKLLSSIHMKSFKFIFSLFFLTISLNFSP